MSPTAVYECMGQFHILYLDNRQHSLIIVWVGLDLKALCGISVDYRVGSSPRPRVWVVSVVYCQVDHHTRRALMHLCLKLLEERERQITICEQEELRIPESRDYNRTNETGLGDREDTETMASVLTMIGRTLLGANLADFKGVFRRNVK